MLILITQSVQDDSGDTDTHRVFQEGTQTHTKCSRRGLTHTQSAPGGDTHTVLPGRDTRSVSGSSAELLLSGEAEYRGA